jgi:hypothetical protein
MPTTARKDAGEAEVQKNKDAEEDQGFHGVKVDPTPNEHYTVDGVTSGKPTPETDIDHATKVNAELHRRSRGLS